MKRHFRAWLASLAILGVTGFLVVSMGVAQSCAHWFLPVVMGVLAVVVVGGCVLAIGYLITSEDE